MHSFRDAAVLVTGANGVVGRALLDELRNEGYLNVIGVGASDADLTNLGTAIALLERVRPLLVFHLAAKVHGIMGNLAFRAQTFLENIQINTNLIEASRLVGVQKIVAMGSAAAYSDRAPRPFSEVDIWLGEPHGSEAPYAHAKRTMLAQLEAYHQSYGTEFAYCISTNLYGPHDRFDEINGHVIPSLVSKFHRAAGTGSSVTVWGTGEPTRDFLFSNDAARALRLVGEKGVGRFNLASGTTVPISEVVSILADIAGLPPERVKWDTTKPDGQVDRAYDVARLRSLGFEPLYPLAKGLGETFSWYSRHAQHARR